MVSIIISIFVLSFFDFVKDGGILVVVVYKLHVVLEADLTI